MRLNFQGKFLKNIKIPGALLVNIELQKVRFEESDLSGAIFSGSDLSDALLLNSVAVKSVLGIPELIDANLDLNLQELLLIPPNLYQTIFFWN